MPNKIIKQLSSWLGRLAVGASMTLALAGVLPSAASAGVGIQVGTLVCSGSGGWGAVITSRKAFNCTYSSVDNSVRSSYNGVIQKYGIDVGRTGNTTLVWLVFAPSAMAGGNFVEGALGGKYVGVGGEVSVGLGVGGNALVGGLDDSFSLQPVSVQVQSGLSIAAAVETLRLTYVGPLQ